MKWLGLFTSALLMTLVVACGNPIPAPTPTPVPTLAPTALPSPIATPVPPPPTATPAPAATPTRCAGVPGPGGFDPCPTPTPAVRPTTAPANTPTGVPATPTPCVSAPGPGGFNPCPTPAGGNPLPTPTPRPATTPTPTPIVGGGACQPFQFEPNPPGVPRPVTLSTGYTTKMAAVGSTLYNMESFGYSVLTGTTAIYYHDMRFGAIPAAGDGTSYTYGLSVTPDGQRMAVGLGGPGDGWGTAIGSPSGAGFTFMGTFGDDRPTSVIVQHVGSRYLAYSIGLFGVTVADVTTLPTSLSSHNIASEATGWPGGMLAVLAGGYLVYVNSGTIYVVNVSAPGPVGAIASGMSVSTLTAANFGGRVPQYFTAAVDGGSTYLLVELRPAVGENSPSYGLMRIGSPAILWRVPAATGETWSVSGISAAIANGRAIMPATRFSPLVYRLYSVPLSGFGTQAPKALDVPFGFGMPSTAGGALYFPTGPAGWAVPWSCL